MRWIEDGDQRRWMGPDWRTRGHEGRRVPEQRWASHSGFWARPETSGARRRGACSTLHGTRPQANGRILIYLPQLGGWAGWARDATLGTHKERGVSESETCVTEGREQNK